jgi:hypothetical protein
MCPEVETTRGRHGASEVTLNEGSGQVTRLDVRLVCDSPWRDR